MIFHPTISAIQQSDGSIVSMGAVDEGKLLLRSGNQIIGQPLLDIVHGRMDLVSATRIKYSFLQSNQIVLWDGDSWNLVAPSTEPYFDNTALDMNGDALAVDKIYDVFAKHNSTTQWDFAFAKWAVATAGSSARYAAWVTATAYKIGQRVSSGTHYYACIHAHTSGASTEPGTGASWTNEWIDCGVDPGTDFRGLYQHDGRWTYGPVSTGSNVLDGRKYRWLGVIYTYNNSNVVNFKDERNYRYISNIYNTVAKIVNTYCNDYGTYTYTTATTREVPGQIKGRFVLSRAIDVQYTGVYQAAAAGTASMLTYLGVNATDSSGKISITSVRTEEDAGACIGNVAVSVGNHYITQLEYGGSNTPSIYGYHDRITASIMIGA